MLILRYTPTKCKQNKSVKPTFLTGVTIMLKPHKLFLFLGIELVKGNLPNEFKSFVIHDTYQNLYTQRNIKM